MKKCTKCHELKPVDDFYKHSKRPDGRFSYCKQCTKEYRTGDKNKQYFHAWSSQEKNKTKRRSDNLKKYGLTHEDYNRMLQTQNEVCAICNGPETNGKALSVDHCHTTQAVRGLLCHNCNLALGLFEQRRIGILRYLGLPHS